MEVGGRVALSGEEAGKWDEQGRSQAESWIQLEPSLRLVPEAKEESGPQLHPPLCPTAFMTMAAWAGSSNFPWEGVHLAKGSSSAPSQQLEEKLLPRKVGLGRALATCTSASFWCAFQHPKRISPTPHGLDLKSNHSKHSIETG